MKYKVVAILWEDHIHYDRSPIIKKPSDAFVRPTLTVGILLKEDKKGLIVVSDIERYEGRNESTYTVILKGAVVSIKEFGEIKIKGLS
jgi:hypothetical protein